MISPLTFFHTWQSLPLSFQNQKYISCLKLGINLAFLSSREKRPNCIGITVQYVLSHLLSWKALWYQLHYLPFQAFILVTFISINNWLFRASHFCWNLPNSGLTTCFQHHSQKSIHSQTDSPIHNLFFLFLVGFDWKGKFFFNHIFICSESIWGLTWIMSIKKISSRQKRNDISSSFSQSHQLPLYFIARHNYYII